jgi:hypothetical protein
LLVTTPSERIPAFQALFASGLGFDVARIGHVTDAQSLLLTSNDGIVLESGVQDMVRAFKATLDW